MLEKENLFLPTPKGKMRLSSKDRPAFIEGDYGKFASGEEGSESQGEFIRPPLERKTLKWALFIMFAGLGLLTARVATLQLAKGNIYHALAEGNRLRVRNLPSERGVILDRNNKLLVENIPTFSLFIVPGDLPKSALERERVLQEVSRIAELERSEIDSALLDFSGSTEPIPIKLNLNYQNALSAEIKISGLPGVLVNQDTRRNYIPISDKSNSLSHILGYVGLISKEEYNDLREKGYFRTEKIGKSGLESYYEQILKGTLGKEKIEVDALGRKKGIIAAVPPIAGKNLVLTIDLEAQKALEDALKRSLLAHGSDRGTAIAMDPRNGEIIAFVNLPSFSSNDFASGIKNDIYQKLLANPGHPLFMRGISGEFPSGSTIKPIIAAAALDEGVITASTIVHSSGGIAVGEWFFPDWKAGGHGDVNVIRALAQSVNTFFYYIGGGFGNFSGLGAKAIAEHAAKFGLGQKLGIDLAGEKTGLLPTEEWKKKQKNERWYIGDTYHMAIGQGDILVTPLQIAAATAALANGGTVWKPYLTKAVQNPDGSLETTTQQSLQKNAAKPESIAVVKRGMRETVISGSARYLGTLPFAVAGKTGTAEWQDGKRFHAWFTGFAPYDNPQIVITILIEEGGEGSESAVPVAREFLSWYFSR